MDEPTTLEAAFGKIRLQINSTIAPVRRPSQLLLAIDSTLKNQDDESDVVDGRAYFVALESTLVQLMTTTTAKMIVSKNKADVEKIELLEATLYLLSLLVPHLSGGLLRTKSRLLVSFNICFNLFNQQAPALKSLIIISQFILSSQSSNYLEKDQDARSLYASILTLSGDHRPKVRRKAQEAITAILSAPPPPAVLHPYSILTSNYILQRLEEAVKGAKRGGKREESAAKKDESTGSDEGRAIALLVFVKNLASAWYEPVSLNHFVPIQLLKLILKQL
jgi:ribosomal RNA-processing protein 12